MKRLLTVIILLALLTLLFGCTQYTRVNSDQLNVFKKDMKSQFKQVNRITVQFAPTRLQIMYALNQKLDEHAISEIFVKTRELIQSHQFQDDALRKSYFKKYAKPERSYPSISISFDTNLDGESEFEFSSGDGSDGYRTWYYSNFKEAPRPVLP